MGKLDPARNYEAQIFNFIKLHLHPWVPDYIQLALPYANSSYYQAFYSLLCGLLDIYVLN